MTPRENRERRPRPLLPASLTLVLALVALGTVAFTRRDSLGALGPWLALAVGLLVLRLVARRAAQSLALTLAAIVLGLACIAGFLVLAYEAVGRR